MDKQALQQMLDTGEGQSVEFKQTTATASAAIRTIAAFASQPQGGTVVFGANNDGSPYRGFNIGPETSAKLAGKIKAATISMTTGHALQPLIHAFTSPNRLAVHVPAGTDATGPYLAFGRRYQRSGTATIEVAVNYPQLARVFQQHLTDGPGGVNFCPQCGSPVRRSTYLHQDDLYYVTSCTATKCHWMDASE